MKISKPDYLDFPHFLNGEIENHKPEEAKFHIIPVPYEKTVSYGGGTKFGPSAILKASEQLELFDGKGNPSLAGIHTKKEILSDTPEALIELMTESISNTFESGKIPVVLGGEHTVSVGTFPALKKYFGEKVGIVQIDAHADLRDSYEESEYSHACVMKRAIDMDFNIFQIGIRSLSLPEVRLRKEKNIQYMDAVDIYKNGIPEKILPQGFPEKVYLTIDVDGLDPSIMPATGTPEPGGLSWYETLEIIEKISKEREIIGFDLVELAPIESLHFPEFTVARLIYQIMGMLQS